MLLFKQYKARASEYLHSPTAAVMTKEQLLNVNWIKNEQCREGFVRFAHGKRPEQGAQTLLSIWKDKTGKFNWTVVVMTKGNDAESQAIREWFDEYDYK